MVSSFTTLHLFDKAEIALLVRSKDAILDIKTRRLAALTASYNMYVSERTAAVQRGMAAVEEVELSQANRINADAMRAVKKTHQAELRNQPKQVMLIDDMALLCV